jgi:hypothetical protein
MKYIDYFDAWSLHEILGISEEVEIIKNKILTFIEADFLSHNFIDKNIILSNLKEIDVENINIIYTDKNYVGAITKIDNTLRITLNPKYIDLNNLNEILIHDINHIYTEFKGLKTNPEYLIAFKLSQELRNEKCEYTKEFLRAVYLTSETEILANVQELYETIKRNEITSKQEFTKFIVNSPIYKEYKSLEKIEAMSFWKNIINEKTLDLLLTSFGINDIDKSNGLSIS